MPENRARTVRNVVLAGAALVVLAPVMSGIGQYDLVWSLAVAGIITAAVACVYSWPDPSLSGAGFLLFGSLIMPVWAWFGTAVLFSGDVVRQCGQVLSGASPNLVISKSLLPPGVFCFPNGAGSLPVLATPLETFLPALVTLLVILAPLVAATWLVLRKSPVRIAADQTL